MVLSFQSGRRIPKRTRKNERDTAIERLLQALKRSAAPVPPSLSEDEHFLLNSLPSLQRLPAQQKEFVKFQIHKLIYEASTVVLNLEPVE